MPSLSGLVCRQPHLRRPLAKHSSPISARPLDRDPATLGANQRKIREMAAQLVKESG
jgi:hypothetical protein